MIEVYCRRKHGGRGRDGLCDSCSELLEYARRRLDHCRHGARKSSCRKCSIHCYSPARREEIRSVMRYVGPRMIFTHPLSALKHFFGQA